MKIIPIFILAGFLVGCGNNLYYPESENLKVIERREFLTSQKQLKYIYECEQPIGFNVTIRTTNGNFKVGDVLIIQKR